MNGFTCTIAPDTGAEVMIVPGKLVYELQLLQDWVYVKGLSGKPVLLQFAMVPFSFEGREFSMTVAVAKADTVKDKVQFVV